MFAYISGFAKHRLVKVAKSYNADTYLHLIAFCSPIRFFKMTYTFLVLLLTYPIILRTKNTSSLIHFLGKLFYHYLFVCS